MKKELFIGTLVFTRQVRKPHRKKQIEFHHHPDAIIILNHPDLPFHTQAMEYAPGPGWYYSFSGPDPVILPLPLSPVQRALFRASQRLGVVLGTLQTQQINLLPLDAEVLTLGVDP